MPESDPLFQQRLGALRQAATLMAARLEEELEEEQRTVEQVARRQTSAMLRLWFWALATDPVLRKFRGWRHVRRSAALRWSVRWLRVKTGLRRMLRWR
jgi:hypothetical protein